METLDRKRDSNKKFNQSKPVESAAVGACDKHLNVKENF